MNKKENASVHVGAWAEAAETAAGMAHNSHDDFITLTSGRQPSGRIWQLLPEGEAMAIPASDFAKLAGYGSTRSLRAAVDSLRSSGVPVLATENGYFKPISGPAGITEIKRFLRRQDARMASNRRTTRLIRAKLREIERGPLDGQETLFNGGTANG